MVEEVDGASAGHVVAVVATVVVIGGEPRVGLALELMGGSEVASVERGTPALLEHGALESFDDRVVVRGAGRDLDSADLAAGERFGEGAGHVFGAVVRDHGADRVTESGRR